MTDGLPAPPAAGVAEIDDVRTTEADFSKRLLSRAASEMFGMVANEIRAEESVRDALASALLTFVFAQLLDMLLRNKTCDDINTIVTLCLSEFMDQLKDALFDLAVTQGAKSRPTNIKNLSNPLQEFRVNLLTQFSEQLEEVLCVTTKSTATTTTTTTNPLQLLLVLKITPNTNATTIATITNNTRLSTCT
jgi:hypothetical protein